MTVRNCLLRTAAWVAVIAVGRPAGAALPEIYLKRWNDPVIQKRIDAGIERNRKSDVVLTVLDSAGNPVAGAEVRVTQKSHAFLFGCNLFVLGQMKEKELAYEEAFLKLFNFATVPFYWRDLEPEDGKPRFAEGSPYIWSRPRPDRIVAFAKKHGLTLKGHPLLWHALNPAWMPKDPDKLKQRYIRRFKEIADRYAKDILIWDGVNESLVCSKDFPLFSGDRTYPACVPWAFSQQQKLFRPENLLMINDVTSFHWPANDSNRYYQQCKRLLENGVPIEGIGFQFHFFSRKALDDYLRSDRCDPGTLLDTYELFAKLGLPLWITEITIGSAGDDGLAIQERVVRDHYRLWFSSPKMAGITWWNLGDGTAYGNENAANGGLTDEEFNPKPAYKALDQLINHQWRTNITTRSGPDGSLKFRGFHAGYTIQVTAKGKTQNFELAIKPGGPVRRTLRIQ